jgi:coproporphyrinogen III oxidase
MNVRYFETNQGKCWFGGGIDLTPMYVDPLAAAQFHKQLKEVCDDFDSTAYTRYKTWADEYFFLPHRNETRGVGGIFFDHLIPASEEAKRKTLEFCLSLGRLFPVIYKNQTLQLHDEPTPEQLEWQAIRRARYVEYNLLFDRGTKFGIVSNGRTESILLSMPPMAQWKYNVVPQEGTKEFETLSALKKDVDWISFL